MSKYTNTINNKAQISDLVRDGAELISEKYAPFPTARKVILSRQYTDAKTKVFDRGPIQANNYPK